MGYGGGFDHLVDALMLGATLGREAQHGHTGSDAGDIAGGLSGAHGDLGKPLAEGSGTTAQSAKIRMPSVPKGLPSGRSIRNAPDTTSMPG